MSRATALFLFAIVLLCPTVAGAQQIETRRNPGAGCWYVYYTKQVDRSELGHCGGIFKTYGAAQEEAARLQRYSAQLPNDDLGRQNRVTRIVIDGEDAAVGPPAQASPKSPNFFDAVQQNAERNKALQDSLRNLGMGKTETGQLVVGLLTNPGSSYADEVGEKVKGLLKKSYLKDFGNNSADAYRRAKDAKDELLGMTGTLADKNFQKVNALVDKYNQEAAKVPVGLEGFGGLFPKATRVGPDTMKKVEEWRAALKQQFALEQQKENLDKRKADLDRQREKLAADWMKLQEEIKPFNPEDPRVISVRDRLNQYTNLIQEHNTSLASYVQDVGALSKSIVKLRGRDSSGGDGLLAGPFRLFMGQYSNTADLKGGGSGEEIQSFADAHAKGENHMSANANKQPSYRIEDKDGKVVEARGLFRNVKETKSKDQTSYLGVWELFNRDGSRSHTATSVLLLADGTARSLKGAFVGEKETDIGYRGTWRVTRDNEITITLTSTDPQRARAYGSSSEVITITGDGEGFRKDDPKRKCKLRRNVRPNE